MNYIVEFQQKNALLADGIIGKLTIQAMRCKWNIFTDAQMANLLANVNHETGAFKISTENLNYSSSGLLKTFPKYFPNSTIARQYANQPQKIANKVYANRMGNGSELSGDGWKYRGRGSIQLTGKNNYLAFSGYMNDPEIMLNPDIVATKYFWETALFYFEHNNLWTIAKGNTAEDVKKIRKAINGGYNGLDSTQKLFDYYYNLITK